MRPSEAEHLVTYLNEHYQCGLTLMGVAEQGATSGAVYVRWPDGHDGVLTQEPGSVASFLDIERILALARERDVPTPRFDLVAPFEDQVVLVQQRLPGAPTEHVDAGVIDQLVEMNERFGDLLDDRRDVPVPALHLTTSGPGYCLHETLEGYSSATRDVLRLVQEIVPAEMVGSDLLHADFTPGNILFGEDGAVSGVVDWGRCERGDRRFALVKLRFDLAWTASFVDEVPTIDPDAIDRLDAHLERLLGPVTLRTYWAHWSLHMLDWTIRVHADSDVRLHLDLARLRL